MEALTPIPEAGSSAQGTEEDRTYKRRRTLMSGMISCDGLFSAYPCCIRNISEGGAMIVVEQLVALPARFTLLVELSGFKVDCIPVWQKGTVYGLRFVSERQETSFKRMQVVSTSQNALSERTVRGIEMREKMADEQAAKDVKVERPAPIARQAFGRRT